jgi:hypothetical protein
MPLKLTVGLARKVGQPHYGSLGASCGVEVELENSLLGGDPDAFRARVRDAFVACRRAVELERLQAAPDGKKTKVGAEHSGTNGTVREDSRARRPATPRQLRTIVAIARRQRANSREPASHRVWRGQPRRTFPGRGQPADRWTPNSDRTLRNAPGRLNSPGDPQDYRERGNPC